jgi:ADP-dependent NAD(P)H-hydrate dehydratase / NAD(P)H-hydrate epimerase
MKIFSAEISREVDELTILKQNINSLDLMERAANEAYLSIIERFPDINTSFDVYCGVGNNGGDGLVIARKLLEKSYKVRVFIVTFNDKYSEDFKSNLIRLGSDTVYWINSDTDWSEFKSSEIIIDAIFGTGLTRKIDLLTQQTIGFINQSDSYVIAIDVPSGMFLENKTESAIQSDWVLTFQNPKLAFFLPDNRLFCKEISIIPIGLDPDIISKISCFNFFIDAEEAKKRYLPISKFSHKGIQGHSLIIGGSYGKMGAVVLAAKAALKAGCGLITTFIPKCGYGIVQSTFPEAMVVTDTEADFLTAVSADFIPDAIGIGMGIGQNALTKKALLNFLKNNKVKLVVDADALNILSLNKEGLVLLPEDSILTPHPKELERLIGKWEDDFVKIERTKQFSKKYNVIVLIKGAHTLIIKNDYVFVNGSGNQALATAGSGDVLSGIITGLLAQSYKPVDAAILGVFLHGRSADIAVPETGYESFIASDIINNLGKAFVEIEKY